MGKIRKIMEIKAKPEEVFAYLDDPRHISREMHFQKLHGKIDLEILSKEPTGLGAIYRWRGTILGWKVDFTEVVTKWIKNREKASRPLLGVKSDIHWSINWSLISIDKGTKIAWNIEYGLPYSWFGKLIDRLLIKRYLERGLSEGFKEIKNTLESKAERNYS